MLNKIVRMPVTMMIIFVWIVIWVLVASNKTVLSALGGKGLTQIGNQYYRFFTAGLTHENFIHLLFNVCFMFWIGYLYENRVGSIKFLLVALVCAVVCQVIFLAIYRNVTSSIGGSAYNFALCGFGLTMQFLVPDFPKIELGTWSGNWIIISLIAGNVPIMSFMNVSTIVFHLVAFVLGVGAAFVIPK